MLSRGEVNRLPSSLCNGILRSNVYKDINLLTCYPIHSFMQQMFFGVLITSPPPCPGKGEAGLAGGQVCLRGRQAPVPACCSHPWARTPQPVLTATLQPGVSVSILPLGGLGYVAGVEGSEI